MGVFVAKSVAPKTLQAYDRHWADWCSFVEATASCQGDPLLLGWSDQDKAGLVALFISKRYERGLRGKQATSVTASIRLRFTRALLPTGFLDGPVLEAARNACRLNPKEIRDRKDKGPSSTVKIALCQSMLTGMRKDLWADRSWGAGDIDSRMVYLGCMWGFDQDARVSEYTAPAAGHQDHCVRLADLQFECMNEEGALTSTSSADSFGGLSRGSGEVQGCWVRTSTHKTGTVVKQKFIGRRALLEEQFLNDLVEWILHSGVNGSDRLFTRYTDLGKGQTARKELHGRMIREQIKKAAMREEFDPAFFSSHSLRKGATTQMRALGVSDADIRDRGNYASGSEVMRITYDYSTAGHGPLSALSINGGAVPDVEAIRRYLPKIKEQQSVAKLGRSG